MATIYHATPITSEVDTSTEFEGMEDYVVNYWGTALEEKIYPVPFWKIIQMFNASPSEQVALHVTDLSNRALVDAEWVVYNDVFEPQLAALPTPDEYYYVLHESVFQIIRNTIPTFEKPINSLMMWGRLGKLTAAGSDYSVFLVAAEGSIIDLTGGGGDGLTTGVRIPPQV